MPENELLNVNSEEIQEIITQVPSWILRAGITVIFLIILSIVLMSSLIQYPDIIEADLKINSLNTPKSILAKQTGKIVSLLVRDGAIVKQNQPIAYMESVGDHSDVIKLQENLSKINTAINKGEIGKLELPINLNLGELQDAYRLFHQEYLQYIDAQKGGYYLSNKAFLEKDLSEIESLKQLIITQRKIQELEYANVEQEYLAYKKLYEKGVISTNEFKNQENKYLAGKYPLQQTQSSILNNSSAVASKRKEILSIEHTIAEQKLRFMQVLRNMMSETDAWLYKYVLKAPVQGTVAYAGIIQENQTVNANQELFVINTEDTNFFGELSISQYNMGKIITGQRALIKMKSYPFEQYGLIRGKISYISEVAFRDSVFIGKVVFDSFENKDRKHKIVLKNGMRATAEIVTEQSSVLQRFTRSFTKMMNSN
ncbi:HlyD family secretion protein [Pedobacter terrae]|uniref:HlyD family secretion protein n=1 Tax=Pedobacter terrae TaxID=405671 RepID=A0A1G8CKB9_9SPHI|nr:HlyD family efflux transporter periplasmic adaptor subunit [Pedobacter terrae]SDH45350.1 HlyD family secretion protein [Pedobacter terrae]